MSNNLMMRVELRESVDITAFHLHMLDNQGSILFADNTYGHYNQNWNENGPIKE